MKFRTIFALAIAGATAGLVAYAAGVQASAVTLANAPALPGMPPVLDPNDIYAADHAGKLADAVKGFPSLVYVPNSRSDTVDVIDQKTFKIVGHFPSGGHEPQHVVPS